MKKFFFLVLLLFCVFGAGCGEHIAFRADYVVLETPPEITLDESHGAICFIRSSTDGALFPYSFFITKEENNIGVLLPSGSYFHHTAPVGRHTYIIKGIVETYATFEIKPNSIHYVVVVPSSDADFYAVNEITEKAAQHILDKGLKCTRLSTPTEKAAHLKTNKHKKYLDK